MNATRVILRKKLQVIAVIRAIKPCRISIVLGYLFIITAFAPTQAATSM